MKNAVCELMKLNLQAHVYVNPRLRDEGRGAEDLSDVCQVIERGNGGTAVPVCLCVFAGLLSEFIL